MAAAQTGSTHGIAVMRRAPYLIPARSHSGNVAVQGLALRDLLDILSSDHVPLALLHAALTLNDLWGDLGGATVTFAPALTTGLADRVACNRG